MPDVMTTMSVNLAANTVSFDGPLAKANANAKRTAKDIESSFNDMDFSEAKGGLTLLGDEIGVKLPRHVRGFVAELPGVGAALNAAFPILAVVAIGTAIFEATEKMKKHNEELVKARQESLDVAVSLDKQAESLHLQNLRLEDQIAILQKRPVQNGPAIAAEEAKIATTHLIEELQKAIDKEGELLDKQRQGFLSKLTSGDTGQNDLIDKAQQFKEEIDDLVQKRTVAEKIGTQQEVKDYTAAIAEKQRAFKQSLADEQQAIKDAHINARKNLADRLSSSSVPVPESSVTAQENAMEKSFNDTFKQRINILNDLIILTHSYDDASREQAKNNSLNIEKANTAPIEDMTQKVIHASKILKELKKQNDEVADAGVKAGNDLAGYFQKLGEQAQKSISQQDAASDSLLKQAQQTRDLSEAQERQNTDLAVANGYMTQQQAASKMLVLLEANKKDALTAVNAQLTAQLAKVKQITDATLGGLVGTDQEKAAYAEAAAQYQKLKEQQLSIEKDYNKKISDENKKLSVNEVTQWRSTFRDWQNVQKQTSQVGLQTLNSLNSNLTEFVTTGKANWTQMAQSAIASMLEIGLHYAESKAGMAVLDTIFGSQKDAQDAKDMAKTLAKNGIMAQSDANLAAAKTLSDVPFPENIPASITVLTTGETYAAGASAAKGGILPNREMLVHTHPEEMILPQRISNFIVNAASRPGRNDQQSQQNGPVYAPVINAGLATAKDVDKAMKGHFDAYMRKEARRRGMRY